MNKMYSIVVAVCVIGLATGGCEWLKVPAKYKDALPEGQDLVVKIGSGDVESGNAEARGAIGTIRQAELDRFAECDECCIEEREGEQWYISGDVYEATREAKWHVNGGLVTVFGWIDFITDFPVSEETDEAFIWGPWTESLSRITFRFVMDKTQSDDFTFRLEGKNINDDSANWRSVVAGEVQSTGEAHRVAGKLEIDFDAIHEVDTSHPSAERGRVSYDFDVRELPYSVDVTFNGFASEGEDPFDAVYHYERRSGLAGEFRFEAMADVTGPEDRPDGIVEELEVRSEWNSNGQGIGNALVSGGSLDSNVATYKLEECWADAEGLYYQTFRAESVELEGLDELVTDIGCGTRQACPEL